MLDYGNIVYNHLASKGLITFTKAEKADILQCAKAELVQETKKRAKNIITLKVLLGNITNASLAAKAKRIALYRYFARITETEEK